ncbi:hypothetical protein PENSPDRAFT_91121 [Peniophora sp. CONT]|nr:hypothetical protein PENSPDRAFT_91121 [Peniophora sp. CONT]
MAVETRAREQAYDRPREWPPAPSPGTSRFQRRSLMDPSAFGHRSIAAFAQISDLRSHNPANPSHTRPPKRSPVTSERAGPCLPILHPPFTLLARPSSSSPCAPELSVRRSIISELRTRSRPIVVHKPCCGSNCSWPAVQPLRVMNPRRQTLPLASPFTRPHTGTSSISFRYPLS